MRKLYGIATCIGVIPVYSLVRAIQRRSLWRCILWAPLCLFVSRPSLAAFKMSPPTITEIYLKECGPQAVIKTLVGRTIVVNINDLSKPSNAFTHLSLLQAHEDIEYYPFSVKGENYIFNKHGKAHEDKLLKAILNGIHI